MKVLFICTGNICRSALAECILRKMAEDAGRTDIQTSSAGTYDLHGEEYDPTMVEVAKRHGYDMAGKSKLMTDAMLQEADLILVMEEYHYVKVQRDLPYTQWSKLHIINKFCYDEMSNIKDPYFGSDALFEQVFLQIEQACQVILSKI